MEKRALGTSSSPSKGEPVAISPIGLGCMGMSEFYGPADEATSIDVIHHALDVGVNFFDTADMYGVGRNEELVGRALRDRRDRAVIATKFAIMRGEDGSRLGISGKPEYVKAACEASLKRLGIDTIDLYYQHRVDTSVPIEDTVGAMADLVRDGKVKHLGLSEASVETLRRACKVHPIAALQSEYSLWSREPEKEHLGACKELGVTFVAYSPLGRGFLTGAIRSVDALAKDDFRRRAPRLSGDNFDRNLALVAKVEGLAKAKGISAAQLALAWVITRAPHVVAIPGTTKRSRLDENVGAAKVTFSDDEIAALDAILPPGAAHGDRYDAGGMNTVDR